MEQLLLRTGRFDRNGDIIQDKDVVEVLITNASGDSMIPYNERIFIINYFLLDCTGATCNQSGPFSKSSFWAAFDSLAPGTYNVEIEMANGQVLRANADFPGQTMLPFVSSSTMNAAYVGGDLELSWIQPIEDADWDLVDTVRVAIYDGAGAAVLYISVPPTQASVSVTIPASLVAAAQALGDGTLNRWQVQSRAYDANHMNYARAFSKSTLLP